MAKENQHTKSCGDRRTDGLRDDVDDDAGFSFAVGEAAIEVDSARLDRTKLEAVHRILWEAGTDNWMDYSHLRFCEAKDLPSGAKLAMTCSSARKGARVIMDLAGVMGLVV